MTKIQIIKSKLKSNLGRVIVQLEKLQDKLLELHYEVEETSDEIVPQEDENYITSEQKDIKQWLDKCATAIGDAADDIEDITDKLDLDI